MSRPRQGLAEPGARGRVFAAWLVLACGAPALAQSAPLRPPLALGPHAVGFGSRWALDPARTYDTTFADGSRYADGAPAPRPLLIDVWYPAARRSDAPAPALSRGEYLDILSAEARFAAFSRALQAYAREVVAQEVLERGPAERDERDGATLAALLAEPTVAVRDAPPEGGRFPLVLFHSGYGSSFEDNASLFEFLASRGYVVGSSAFEKGDGSSFNVDGAEGSLRDLEFLARELAARPDVDAARVALAGHSGGAHVTLRATAEPQAAWSALISLDTTQDYWSVREPRWTHVAPLLAHPERVHVPLFVAASREAIFDLTDRLSASDRWYATFRDLEHDDYTEQGVLTAEVAARRAAPAEAPAARRHADAVRAQYATLCESLALFLDSALKGDGAAAARLGASGAKGGDGPFVLEHLAPGVTAPVAWEEAAGVPADPRQLRGVLARLGAQPTLELLELWQEERPELPLFGETFGLSLVWELVDQGRLDDARVLAPFYARLEPAMGRFYLFLCDRFPQPEFHAWRGTVLQAAALVDPENARVKAELAAWAQGR